MIEIMIKPETFVARVENENAKARRRSIGALLVALSAGSALAIFLVQGGGL
jgi:hypothetical protein